MADPVKLAATAKRLIDANGRTVTLVKHDSVPSDPDMPWRGVSTPVAATVTGKAVFVPRTQALASFAEYIDGTLTEGEYALFPASDDDGYDLELFDVMIDDSVNWKIVLTEIIAPGDTRILYMFQVKR